MAYKAADDGSKDLERGFASPRPSSPRPTPASSHIPLTQEFLKNKDTNEGPMNRHSTIIIPSWNTGGMHHCERPPPKEKQFRKLGSAAPVGLFSAGIVLFILSLIHLNPRGISDASIAVGVAYAHGSIILFSGIWELICGTCFAATVLIGLGGFWISFALFETKGLGFAAAYTTQADLNSAVGFFLIAWFFFFVLCTFGTVKSNVAFVALFIFLDGTLALLVLAYLAQGPKGEPNVSFLHWGGAMGVITSFLCWWNAMAGLLDHSNSFFTVPVGTLPWTEAARNQKSRTA